MPSDAPTVQPPTSVVVDASQLSGESAGSGIGTYVRGLLTNLAGEPGLRITALATSEVHLPPAVTHLEITRRARQGRLAVWEHELRRPRELRSLDGAVFHNPNPHAPARPRSPWVQTLYDLIPLVYDDPMLGALKRRFERFGPRYARADAVIAISRHAADEGIRLLGLDPSRVEVVHLGVGPEFQPSPDRPDSPPYLSMVSEYSRRKGMAEALAVTARLAGAGHPHRLAFAGKIPAWQREDFEALVRVAPGADLLDRRGFVTDLAAFYRGATVHLMTTRYEGFGLPAVEAMACGTPVVAFANSSLPEIVGAGGILVPDGDVEAMAGEVRRLIENPHWHAEMSGRALARARDFRWQTAAERHAEIYRQVAGVGMPGTGVIPPPPVVSVVVPTYNRRQRLGRLLDALAAQDLGSPFEVVIVDDGGTDGSSAMVEDRSPSLPFGVRIVRPPANVGPAAARNLGWRAARSDRIAFTDDDCAPDPGWLRAIAEGLDGADVVVGPIRPPAEQRDQIGPFSKYLETDHQGGFLTANVAYRRAVLDTVGGFDDGAFRYNGEDTDLGLRARKAGFCDAFAPLALVWHDVHPSEFRAHFRNVRSFEGLVALVSRHPEARSIVGGRLFLRSVDRAVLATWAAAAVVAVAPRRRSGWLLPLAAGGWYVRHFRRSYYPPRSRLEWCTAVPLAFVADNRAVAVMIRASIRHRTVLL